MDKVLKSGTSVDPITTRSYSVVLWLATGLFLWRVIGQLIVATLDVEFLPPMNEWYSGLLPYPIVLPAQFMILILLFSVSIQFSRGQGRFVGPNPRAGRILVARQARAARIRTIVGTQAGETSLLTRAGMVVAGVAGSNLVGHEGAFGTHLLENDVCNPPLMFGQSGMLDTTEWQFTDQPGWGLEIERPSKNLTLLA